MDEERQEQADLRGSHRIIDMPGFAARPDESSLFEQGEVMGQGGGRDVQLFGQYARRKTSVACPDKMTEQGETVFMRQS